MDSIPSPLTFTPGPWSLDLDTYDIVAPGEACIARVYTRDDFPCADPEDVEEWDRAGIEFPANARLIAAAPDLLSALQALMTEMLTRADNSIYARQYFERLVPADLWVAAKDAIALATGDNDE